MKLSVIPIAPKQIFDLKKIEANIDSGLDDGARKVQGELGRNTTTWNHDVRFEIAREKGVRIIDTNDQIYQYVTNGTPAHPIRARNAPYLAFFRTGFRSKTRAGRLGSSGGARATQNFRRMKQVMHPGIQARNFEELTVKKWQKYIVKILETAIKNSVS